MGVEADYLVADFGIVGELACRRRIIAGLP
jgi:hypothetical protein